MEAETNETDTFTAEDVVRIASELGVAPEQVAQAISQELSTAHTTSRRSFIPGEISAAMLRDVGATIALVGHSERRHVYGEGDALVRAKLEAALAGGLDVIFCVGEKLEEREDGQTEAVNARQLTAGLKGLGADDLARITIAYEPVWAIGTGRTASPEQAAEVHGYLRGVLSGLFDAAAAARTRIQYGGSVKPDNAAALMASSDVDGALVGGAALEAKSFLGIVRYR